MGFVTSDLNGRHTNQSTDIKSLQVSLQLSLYLQQTAIIQFSKLKSSVLGDAAAHTSPPLSYRQRFTFALAWNNHLCVVAHRARTYTCVLRVCRWIPLEQVSILPRIRVTRYTYCSQRQTCALKVSDKVLCVRSIITSGHGVVIYHPPFPKVFFLSRVL